jgi:hypothetical protein
MTGATNLRRFLTASPGPRQSGPARASPRVHFRFPASCRRRFPSREPRSARRSCARRRPGCHARISANDSFCSRRPRCLPIRPLRNSPSLPSIASSSVTAMGVHHARNRSPWKYQNRRPSQNGATQ